MSNWLKTLLFALVNLIKLLMEESVEKEDEDGLKGK